MHTLFRMSYLSEILDTPERLCMRVPTCNFLKIKKKKKRNTAKIREQEESNTLLQNKESIHTLNNNSSFENE